MLALELGGSAQLLPARVQLAGLGVRHFISEWSLSQNTHKKCFHKQALTKILVFGIFDLFACTRS
jgi:hypothetical protein